MKRVAERLAITEALARELAQQGRRAMKADLTTVRELIEDEEASRDKCHAAATKPGGDEQYRRNMAKSVETSKTAIDLLNKALQALRDRQPATAAQYLNEVYLLRGKKATQSRGANVSKLYLEYRAQYDTDFHQWLASKGHQDVLTEMGVSVAKPKRTRRSDSNQPENYERGY